MFYDPEHVQSDLDSSEAVDTVETECKSNKIICEELHIMVRNKVNI